MLASLLVLALSTFLVNAEECVHGKRGPPCSQHTDCLNISSCARCAHSGFCTNLPAPGPSPGPHPGPRPGPEGCTPQNKSYDYFLLVQGWPNANCLAHICAVPEYAEKAYWVLHGLWPSRVGTASSSYPCECEDKPFDIFQVSSIKADLEKYWPSFTTDEKFWSHEWTKHGTCASDNTKLNTELAFFSAGLDLRHKHDIVAALNKASIIPDHSKTYTAQQLIAAISPLSNGFDPLLGCNQHSGTQYLQEVSFCLHKTDFINIHCDHYVEYNQPHDEVTSCDHSKPIVLIEPKSHMRNHSIWFV